MARRPYIRRHQKNNVGAMQLLLNHCADVNVHKSKDGLTPLIVAVQNRGIDTVPLLLQHNADVDGKDGHGRTALHWASLKNDVGAIQLLLNHDANVNLHESKDHRRPREGYRYRVSITPAQGRCRWQG